MSWQHIVVAVVLILNVVLAPTLVGDTREYTKGYVAWMSIISAAMLALLVWGQ